MQPVNAKRLIFFRELHGKLLPESLNSYVPRRPLSSEQGDSDMRETMADSLETLLVKESPLLMTVMKWSQYYYDQSSKACQKYYKENVMVTLEKAVSICNNSVTQSGLQWQVERQKRITGTSCSFLHNSYKKYNPDWERRLQFSHNARDFPLYLSLATSHGLSHQKAAQKRYRERMTNCKVLDLGLVVHPKLPFLGFSPDGLLLDQTGNPQSLIEIKCPIDGRSFSSQDLMRLAPYVDHEGLPRTCYKYYGQVQLGMFILGLPYCDFIVYSSSESDYTRKEINFNKRFVRNMMRSLVRVYFKEMLPWLTRREEMDLSEGQSSTNVFFQ